MALEYIKKYWVKITLGIITLGFFGFMATDMIFGCCVDPTINFYLRAASVAVATAVIALFSGKAFEAIFDGVITSPKGIVVGVWITYVGILWHTFLEELPEAVFGRLEGAIGLHDHDHPLHWLHHRMYEIINSEGNLIGSFLIILGGFLILISSQMLNRHKVIAIGLWIAFVMLMFGVMYGGVIAPYFGI